MGSYKDGTKRFEIRHANDLKFAHPDSLAAPVSRPALGRPSSSSSDEQLTSIQPSSVETPPNQFDGSAAAFSGQSKQAVTGRAVAGRVLEVGNSSGHTHATSKSTEPVPASADDGGLSTGPPPLPAFSRPVRTTRNPNPNYVDAICLESVKPWSASPEEISALNRSIGG